MSPARRAGVVTFAGMLFLVSAAFNVVDGVVAIAEPQHFYVPEGDVVVSSYTALGIGLLVIAGFQLLIGFGILARIRAAQVIGLIVVIMGAIVQLAFFKHYPAWAAIILVLDAVMIYALTVHADEFAAARRRQ